MSEPIGLNALIVKALREYGSIHVDLLAKLLGRRLDELENDLQSLEVEGVLKRDGDMINLTEEKKSRWWGIKS
jgi:DeoR/GlpR family transcriptional regulator of sugar metabolism